MKTTQQKGEVYTSGRSNILVDLTGFDPIREKSSSRINDQVFRDIEQNVEHYTHENKALIADRIDRLEHEMNIDRAVMLSVTALSGAFLALGAFRSRKLLGFVGVQLAFLAQHAIQGWCPSTLVFRQLGFRSQKEIESERYALKTLRGDFQQSRPAA